ncbi:hypothetical protein V8E55_006501 [Tylopilus felleus]
MAFLRLFLVFVGATALEYGVIPPSAQPSAEQLREQHGAEHSVSLIILTMRTMIWFRAFLEGSILFALSGYCPPDLARALLHTFSPTTLTSDLTELTPAFLVGTLLILVGSFLRVHCFHALGPRFTLQLSIHPTHTLVTDGVYGIVRHPSYTAIAALWIGYFFCLLDPQGPVVSKLAGLLQAPLFTGSADGNAMLTGVLACMWATVVYLLYLMLNGRMKREDTMLEKNFGEEWRAWAKRVPYRLVPGVC